MNKNGDKYRLIPQEEQTDVREFDGAKLYQIEALRSFADIKAGQRGGYIQSPDNLSQYGECWVYQGACVYGDAQIMENAVVTDNAQVFGNALLKNYSAVCDNAIVCGEAVLANNAIVCDDAQVSGCTEILGDAKVEKYAIVDGISVLSDYSVVTDTAQVRDSNLWDATIIKDSAFVEDCMLEGYCKIGGTTELKDRKLCDAEFVQAPLKDTVSKSREQAKAHNKSVKSAPAKDKGELEV